jgi:hypothetical protein
MLASCQGSGNTVRTAANMSDRWHRPGASHSRPGMPCAMLACVPRSVLVGGRRTWRCSSRRPQSRNDDAPATHTRIRGVRLRREDAHASQPMCILRRTKFPFAFAHLDLDSNEAAPNATKVLVLRPARRWRHCRSKPIAAPSRGLMRSFLSSGKPPDECVRGAPNIWSSPSRQTELLRRD